MNKRMRGANDRRRWRGDVKSIIELIERNPKQHGSKCYQRYDKYQSGMTVRQYVDSCSDCPRPRDAWIDLSWDTARGFIRIYPPGTRMNRPQSPSADLEPETIE